MFALLAALVLALAWSPAAPANSRIRAGSCDIFLIDQTDPIAFSVHKELFGYLLVDLALGDQGEDLFFAFGKLREGAPRPGRARGVEEAYEALGNPGTEELPTP